jgi:threonine synthase
VGWAGLSRYIKESGENGLMVSVETAHPAKFPEEIKNLLGFEPEAPQSLRAVESKPEQVIRLDNNYEHFRKLIIDRYGS